MTPPDLVARLTEGIYVSHLDRLLLSSSVLLGQHLLLLGPSGVGKTYSAHCLAQNAHISLSRIQMMSDMFSSDVIGAEILRGEQFEIRRGPLFAEMVLIDEINRSSSRLYAAFLEALSDGYVTIAGERLALPQGFCALATLNDFYDVGVVQMPVALLERFALSIVFDYPSADDEVAILRSGEREALSVSVGSEDLLSARAEIRAVHTSDALLYYIRDIVHATRREGVSSIISPLSLRAAAVLKELAQLSAWYEGRSYALPEDIVRVLPAVARHRSLLSPRDMTMTRKDQEKYLLELLDQLLKSVPLASLEHADFFDKKHQKIDS